MMVTRREFLARSVKHVGAIGAVVSVPTFGRALQLGNIGNIFGGENCAVGNKTVAFQTVNAHTKMATFPDWREGDCELQGATIRLNDSGIGVFQAQVCTHFTHSKDIWHFKVQLAADAGSKTYLTSYSWDGPKMSEQDHPLFHNWTENFKLPGGAFPGIRYARATSCC